MRVHHWALSVCVALALGCGIGHTAAAQARTDFNPNRRLPAKAPTKPRAKPDTVGADKAAAADSLARKAKVELPLVLDTPIKDEEYLWLKFELPYNGVVELRLYQSADTTGRLVYQENYIQSEGSNQIRLKAKAFKPGQSYLALLTFKGKRYRQPLNF